MAEISTKVPHVTSGASYIHSVTYIAHNYIITIQVLCEYLASGVGRSAEGGTFRNLTRGFIHWQSERMEVTPPILSRSVSNEALYETGNLSCVDSLGT